MKGTLCESENEQIRTVLPFIGEHTQPPEPELIDQVEHRWNDQGFLEYLCPLCGEWSTFTTGYCPCQAEAETEIPF